MNMSIKSLPESTNKRRSKPYPIVAIGGSAGGMEAMTEILTNLSPDTGMAFVYIQHLSPDFPSKLSVILGKATKMPVHEAEHLLKIEPNTVYVIPPDKDMAIVDGMIVLNKRNTMYGLHLPIDQFFLSLAEKQKEGAIGVILSGTASDGTFGLKAIRAAGGVTIAQDASARFQSMPRSAITEDVVDMVLSPADIAKELERLGKKSFVIEDAMTESADEDIIISEDEIRQIIQMLRKSVGVDFSHYKLNTINRRIIRRMLLHKLETLDDYILYLKQHANEINLLYQDMLINVTTFFRDPDSIEYLSKTLLPRIIKNKPPNEPIRVWIPACSTGEEAYSIAMLLVELAGEKSGIKPIQVFATDLSEQAILKARMAIYSVNELINVSPKQLQRFFTKVDGSYRVVKSLRDLCIFAPHNVLKDPPFSRIDLISCCNLMIYLDGVLQKKLLNTFHYALNTEGYLVLGKSESIGSSAQLFTPLEKKYKIYGKKEGTVRGLFDMQYKSGEKEIAVKTGFLNTGNKKVNQINELDKTIDDLLLSKYIPASVVVNNELDIIQFRGSTGIYLEPSPGKASLNLLKMARPGLAFELRNAIHKSQKTNQIFKKDGIQVKWNERALEVCFEVLPLKSETEEKLFLVVFTHKIIPADTSIKNNNSKDKLVKQLEEELVTVREDMRSIIEELEATNEELQSANEEIVSSNEELQSINEELETSKEELESGNEELMTINTELSIRNEQLAEAQAYTEAVFDTIRKAIIVLDKDLRVKSANKTFYSIFEVKEQDTEGTLIYEIGNRQWDIPELRKLLEEIVSSNNSFAGLEVKHNFPGIGEKIMMLNAHKIEQRTSGHPLILLGIDDITEERKPRSLN
jgi:two-component system, chemotaxis family, CheB/CheR fusion protein